MFKKVAEFPFAVKNSWKMWIETILIFSIWRMFIECLRISIKEVGIDMPHLFLLS